MMAVRALVALSLTALFGVAAAWGAEGRGEKEEESAPPPIAGLAWIGGDWVSVNEDLAYTITETWSPPLHETMTGVARTIADGRLVSARAMTIAPRPDGLPVLTMRRLTSTLEDHARFGSAFYPLAAWSATSATFENPGENHPRAIRFERTGRERIRVTYTGFHDGGLHAQPTDFRARHATPPEHPNIARAQLFRALVGAGEHEAARGMAVEDPRRWWERREGEGGAWEIGPAGGAWAAWDEHFRKRTETLHWAADEGSASVTFRETNDYFQMLERGWVTSRVTYFFDGEGRIEGMLIEALGERDPGRTEEFLAWAREHHPEEIEALMPPPEGEIDPSDPARFRALLEEWRGEMGR